MRCHYLVVMSRTVKYHRPLNREGRTGTPSLSGRRPDILTCPRLPCRPAPKSKEYPSLTRLPSTEGPVVTVVLPFRNAAATLDAAVRSIQWQSLPDWRLLLVDDGSTDDSLAMARGFADARIEVLSDGHALGISARLNAAVAATATPYLCRMDADDVAFPERLARQLAVLEAHPEVDIVATSVLVFSTQGGPTGTLRVATDHAAVAARPWRGFLFPHPSWMGRTSFFRRHPYRSRYDGAEDQALLYEACRTGRFLGIDEVLLGYREDARTFGKLQQRRHAYWRAVAEIGGARGDMIDVLLLSLLQPLRIAGDAARTWFGASWAKHRLAAVPPELETRWEAVRSDLAAGPVDAR